MTLYKISLEGHCLPCAAGSDWRLHTGISPDSDTAEQDRWENDIEKATLVLHNKSKLLLPKRTELSYE